MLLSVRLPAPWERVVELSFGVRPGEAYTHRLLLEVRAACDNFHSVLSSSLLQSVLSTGIHSQQDVVIL